MRLRQRRCCRAGYAIRNRVLNAERLHAEGAALTDIRNGQAAYVEGAGIIPRAIPATLLTAQPGAIVDSLAAVRGFIGLGRFTTTVLFSQFVRAGCSESS